MRRLTKASAAEKEKGRRAGRDWVRTKGATDDVLGALAKASAAWGDAYFRELDWLSHTPAQRVFFLLSAPDEGDVAASAAFWGRFGGGDDPSGEFVAGFVSGAVRAWADARRQSRTLPSLRPSPDRPGGRAV